MSPTTQAILTSITASDASLSVSEREALEQIVAGRIERPPQDMRFYVPLLLTQKQAANALGISRVTLWRLTKDAVFSPVELTPGNYRYRRDEVEAVARHGREANLPRRAGRPPAINA